MGTKSCTPLQHDINRKEITSKLFPSKKITLNQTMLQAVKKKNLNKINSMKEKLKKSLTLLVMRSIQRIKSMVKKKMNINLFFSRKKLQKYKFKTKLKKQNTSKMLNLWKNKDNRRINRQLPFQKRSNKSKTKRRKSQIYH